MAKDDDRETKFLENLSLGYSITEAGIKAGYSRQYSRTSIRTKFASPNFIAKIQEYVEQFPETRTHLAKLRLPRLFNIEEEFYKQCETDPELYAKYAKISERDYRLAGLMIDPVQTPQMINIQAVFQVQTVLQEQQVSYKEPKTVLTANKDSPKK